MNQVHSDPTASTTGQGPGSQLAQARADMRLTHAEVAAKLHLSSRQIQALEADDYRALPGPTYVRGYLKSYALLLGLTPGPILDAHARLTASPAAPEFKTISPQKEITSRHHQVRFVTYGVAVLVISLAVAWWQGRDTLPPNPLLTTQEQEVVPSATETVSSTELPSNEMPNAGTAFMGGPATPPVSTGNPEPLPAATSTPIPVAAPTPKPAEIVSPSIITGPRAKLVLHADQDSWVDIRDGRQMKLMYENVAAGRTVTLEGLAPLSIFLGNAAGVRLDFNGKAVDVASHRRGMMARFILGEKEVAADSAR